MYNLKLLTSLPGQVLNVDEGTPDMPLGGLFSAATNIETWVEVIDIAATVLAFMFLVSFLVMIIAVTFKQGQWKKYAQGTAVATFISTITLRAFPFTILAIPSFKQIDELLDLSLLVLTQCIVFMSLIGIAAGLLLRFGYRLIEHPDFYKSYRTILTVSIVVVIISTIIPSIII